MTGRLRRFLPPAALVLVVMLGPADARTDLKSSMAAKLTLIDMDGAVIAQPVWNEPVRLRVELMDVVTGRAPKGIEISGWIRRVQATNRSCEDEAQAFRVTRSISSRAIDLNGALFATLTEDARIGVVDPKLDGRPATMLAAASLPRLPSSFAIDRAGMRALVAFPDAGTVEAVSLTTGEREVLATELDRPTGAVATSTGQIWAALSGGGSLYPLNAEAATPIPVGSGQVEAEILQGKGTTVAAYSADGGVLLVDGNTGRTLFQGRVDHAPADVAFLGEDGLIALDNSGETAELRFFDAFERAAPIKLGFKASHLATSPDGRIVIAYREAAPTLALIDVAGAQVVQQVALEQATVAEIAFTDRAAYIATMEGRYLAVLDLASVQIGKAPILRPIPLGGRGDRSNGPRRLLAPMTPLPQMLVVERASQTGWVVPDVAAVGNIPPDYSIKLGGGLPLQVHVVDRSFREIAPGAFETVTRIGEGGDYELVLTTGIAGLTTCIGFHVEGPGNHTERRLFTFSVLAKDGVIGIGHEETLDFRFQDENGHEIATDAVRFLVPNLQSGWSTEIVARRQDGGGLKAVIRFPHAGSFVFQPIDLPRRWTPKSSVVLEVPQ